MSARSFSIIACLPLASNEHRVFEAFDQGHAGQLGPAELEALLCDEEVGCPFEDTVPAALRTAEVESRTNPADSSSKVDEAAPGGLDLPAFSRLLRVAQQDRLELYSSRRARHQQQLTNTSEGAPGSGLPTRHQKGTT